MTARPVARSMFPDITPDRPGGALLGSVLTGTNATLVIDIPARGGQLHHVLPADPERARWHITQLAVFIPDATWTVETSE